MPVRQLALVGRRRTTALRGATVQGFDLAPRLVPLTLSLQVTLGTLIDRGVHEHREQHRRRAVDGHRHGSRRQAQIEAGIQLLHVIECRDGDTRIPGPSIDVGTRVRILAIQGRRIESGRKARRAMPPGDVVKAAVRPFRRTLAREHTRWIFLLAAVRIDTARVREGSRQVFRQKEMKDLAPIAEFRHRQLRHALASETLCVVLALHYPVTDLVGVGFVGSRAHACRPCLQLADGLGSHLIQRLVVGGAQFSLRTIRRGVGQSGIRESLELVG